MAVMGLRISFLRALALWTSAFVVFGSSSLPSRLQAGGGGPGPIVINEIHYAPSDKTVPEEFIELYNNSAAAIDVSGWYFSDGISFTMPPGTVIDGFGFLVVAQDPDTIRDRFGDVLVVGPWEGRLSNKGEEILLRNEDGGREDEVDYRRGFPWPTVGGSESFSIELLHPDLSNQLGGSWRAANPGESGSGQMIPAGADWRYRKGTSEAPANWRDVGFNDGSWESGALPIGYGENFVETTLADMRNGYTSVYLRKSFDVTSLDEIGVLLLQVVYDDGFNAWINGVHVAGANVSANELSFDGTAGSAREDHGFNDFTINNPGAFLVEGTNVLTVHLHNTSIGGSSDCFLDVRLVSARNAGAGPTPAARNTVYTENAPPQLRQVQHFPEQPAAGEDVPIVVKATDPDGVLSVRGEYQVVRPGSYIRLTDGAYESGWTELVLLDDGQGLDVEAGDDLYTGVIPRSAQGNRNLVRYRFTAEDTTGQVVNLPYADDPQPNFAYFVYNGIPAWRGASRPGTTPVRTFSQEVMRSIPAYHLIAQESDVINSQYNSGHRGRHFYGTLVYDNIVYDHMEFENRGEFSTYVSGKNKWRFHFQRGHEFQARDNYGRKFRSKWDRTNLGACATPWVPTNRGMAGMGECIGYHSYELAGNPSSKSSYFQLRIIDQAAEAHATDQYRGDLWGLYYNIEHTDGAFLDERDLPDGNTYKLEGGNGDKRNQGPTQSRDASDYNALKRGYNRSQPISWWHANVDLEGYFNFRATNRAINNMDLREGWNAGQYHNPYTDRWTVLAWDLDMLYMPLTHWSGVMNFQNCLSQHSTLAMEYRNRTRELRDLVFNEDQFGQLVAQYVSVLSPPGSLFDLSDVDEAMWNYHPRTAGSHRGAFYRNPSTHSARGGTIQRTLTSADVHGMAQWIFDFVTSGYGQNGLISHSRDNAIPSKPTLTSLGAASFPIDDLRFRTSAFNDPQGAGTFSAMEWRVGQVRGPGDPIFDPEGPPPYEIDAVWESGDVSPFESDVTIPSGALRTGETYRVRVRMRDTTGRWSHWSEPVEFTTTSASTPFPHESALRITEIHYHPAEGSDLEFAEIKNIGPTELDLRPVSFSDGIEFSFSDSDVETILPGEHVLLVNNRIVFENFYDAPDGGQFLIAGEYGGRLSNAGEHITMTVGADTAILDFDFLDDWYPTTDGGGKSLHIVDDLADSSLWSDPENWTASEFDGGSPGRDEGGAPVGGRQLPGDSTQDGLIDISDAIHLIRRLFVDGAEELPCEGVDLEDAGNLTLFDVNGSGGVEIADPIYLLDFLFREGPAPTGGVRCVRIVGCPSTCGF